MEWKIIHIAETDSTNRWLREYEPPTDAPGQPLVVWADYQTAGKGQGTNRWESERDKNLLFSILYHPLHIQANRQFTISMAISLAIVDALEQQIGDVCIKWPNDIYWRNAKIGGILIENRLLGQTIKDSVIGVGLNVNQRQFKSDAPNPISLWQIHGHETDRGALLDTILERFIIIIRNSDSSMSENSIDARASIPIATRTGHLWQSSRMWKTTVTLSSVVRMGVSVVMHSRKYNLSYKTKELWQDLSVSSSSCQEKV